MRLLTLLLGLLLCHYTYAQTKLPTDIAFRRLTTANGLSQDEVHSIVQDKQGFMWFTTINGLCRFDGRNMVQWQVKDKTTLNTMNSGLLITHYIDNDGNFWIGTDHQGIFYYNKDAQKFERFLQGKNNDPSTFFIYKITNYKDTEIWAATNKGLWRYNIKTKKATIEFENEAIKNIKTIKSTTQQPIFFITTMNKGIWQYKKNEWAIIVDTQVYKNINDVHITSTQDSNFIYWVATEQALYTLKNKISTRLLSVKTTSILSDSNNRIWIGAENGLWCYDNKNIAHYIHQPTIKSSISANHIITLYIDKQANIWCGTYTGGISWFSLANQPISIINDANNILFKCKPQYVFTDKGITDTKTGQKWAINIPITNDFMYDFKYFRDSKGNFWYSLAENGLGYFNTTTLKTRIYKANQNDDTQLQHNVVTDIFEDALQNVWITTFGGTHLYQPTTNSFKHLRSIVKTYDETANSTISHFIDRKGNIWLGKWEGGLEVFDPITKKYQHFGTAEGLPNNCIADIHDDAVGNIWVASLNGIAKLSPQFIFTTQKTPIKTYNERDGLPTNRLGKIKYVAATSTEEEKLYFKTTDGIAVLYPSRLKENTYPPQANITALNINGQPYNSHILINDLKGITLSYYQNNITIEMAALSYIQPELNKFKYRLLGFDSTWVNNGTHNTAQYTNLAPNSYTFELVALNNDNIAGTPYLFTIQIKPAWWQTALFKGSIIFLIVLITLFIIQNSIKRIAQREAVARQISESELAMLRAQMNPHFIFNCMNTIEAYIMMEQPDKAAAYTRKFSKLTRAVLENSEKKLIPLETDLDILKIYIELEQTRFQYRFEVEYDIPEAILDLEPNIPPLLLQPIVENAILHGLQHRTAKGGLLKIAVRLTLDQHLECIVEDNGIGRKQSAEIVKHHIPEKQSLAMSITHKRLALLQQTTKTTTNFDIIDLPQGTRAIIRLPLL
jgi:ligand-binding sensor domain-containing protein